MTPAAGGPHHSGRSVPRSHRLSRADSQLTTLAESYLRIGRLSFVVAVPQAFDYCAISALFPLIPDIELVECLTDLEVAASVCKEAMPDGAIIDVSYPGGAAFTVGRELLETGCTRTVAFFDGRFALWRAYKALTAGAGGCYFTRALDANDLCMHIRTRVVKAGNSFVSNVEQLQKYDIHGVLKLSTKEREVMQRLAYGDSIRGIAEKLALAESTIDNHKTRVMKKLNVHRASDLVRIAMAVGLVDWRCASFAASP